MGEDKVVLGLSGGVDSSVVAALLARAIGPQLTCIFVDNGLLRKDEKGEVESAFNNAINDGDMPPLDILTIDAEAEFLGNLQGLDDPEAKRKVIGSTFIDVFDREAHRLEGVKWLAQGTIYPDVIESAASKYGKAHVIKSTTMSAVCHHMQLVGGLPERMAMQLVEPTAGVYLCAALCLRIASLMKDVSSKPPAQNRAASWFAGIIDYAAPIPWSGLMCEFSERSKKTTPMCCARPTRSLSKSYAEQIFTVRCPRPLRSIFQLNQLGLPLIHNRHRGDAKQMVPGR